MSSDLDTAMNSLHQLVKWLLIRHVEIDTINKIVTSEQKAYMGRLINANK